MTKEKIGPSVDIILLICASKIVQLVFILIERMHSLYQGANAMLFCGNRACQLCSYDQDLTSTRLSFVRSHLILLYPGFCRA